MGAQLGTREYVVLGPRADDGRCFIKRRGFEHGDAIALTHSRGEAERIVKLLNAEIALGACPPRGTESVDRKGDDPVCPKCGSNDIRNLEYVAQMRRGLRFEGDTLVIDAAGKTEPEDSMHEHLWCYNCDAEMPMPEKVEYR